MELVVDSDAGARLDAWLWSVRVFKTRAAAADACRRGRVEVDGAAAKPARRVEPGTRVEVRLADHVRILEVVEPISRRVGAAVAVTCYRDHSPPRPPRPEPLLTAEPQGTRDRGAGRPTKKDRRATDRLRGR